MRTVLVDEDRDKASGGCKVARRWRYLVMAVVAASVGLVHGHCTAGSTDSEGLTADGLVPFLNLGGYAPGTSPQRNFNPFSPNKAVTGYTFETLYQVDGTAAPSTRGSPPSTSGTAPRSSRSPCATA